MCRHFCASAFRVYRGLVSMNQPFVKGILHIGSAAAIIENPGVVGFVFGEQELRLPRAQQPAFAVLPMLQFRANGSRCVRGLADNGTPQILAPGPGIPEPQGWQEMQRRQFRPAIDRRYFYKDIFDITLRVFHEDIEITVSLKNAGVQQFKLWCVAPPPLILLQQLSIGKLCLGIFVKHAHVTVRGCGIEVEVVLLYIFAVISLLACQPEHAFFQDGVAAVPECQSETDHLVAVAQATNPVFSPPIGPGVGVFKGKGLPGAAVFAVILPDRAPLAFRKVRPPALPMFLAQPGLLQAVILNSQDSGHSSGSPENKPAPMVASFAIIGGDRRRRVVGSIKTLPPSGHKLSLQRRHKSRLSSLLQCLNNSAKNGPWMVCHSLFRTRAVY